MFKPVVVVGAINVDLVVATDRLPGPGETVVGPQAARHGGGKGANAAVAASLAGATVRLVGAVGKDSIGLAALEELRLYGVDEHCVSVLNDVATGMALIVVDKNGENQIAVGAGANGVLSASHVQAALRDVLPEAGCVLVSSEISGQATLAAVRTAAEHGVPCLLNPAPPIPEVLDLLHLGPILTPNATEVAQLAAMLGDGDHDSPNGNRMAVARRHAKRLARLTHAPVVVTLGGDGALIVFADGTTEHLLAYATAVQDTTGAGDTFNGVLAGRLSRGSDLLSATRAAVVAASLSVAKAGARAGMPRDQEIEAVLTGGGVSL